MPSRSLLMASEGLASLDCEGPSQTLLLKRRSPHMGSCAPLPPTALRRRSVMALSKNKGDEATHSVVHIDRQYNSSRSGKKKQNKYSIRKQTPIAWDWVCFWDNCPSQATQSRHLYHTFRASCKILSVRDLRLCCPLPQLQDPDTDHAAGTPNHSLGRESLSVPGQARRIFVCVTVLLRSCPLLPAALL